MISEEEFENLAVGDTVLTTRGKEGTVNGWNKDKTEVLLKFKGRPLFASPWYRRHEIMQKIMPKVKFEELDMESLNAEDIRIKNVSVTKDKSECDVFINSDQVGERHFFNEELKSEEMCKRIVEDMIKKRDLILQSQEKMEEKLEEVKENRKSEMDKPSVELKGARHDEIEELAKSARPMKFESDEEKLAREGFVRGAIVSRKNAFGEYKGYGILTGTFKKSAEGLILEMTDGSSFNINFVEVCTDVNKQIMRTIEAEKGRIMALAHEFVDLISQHVHDIIYK